MMLTLRETGIEERPVARRGLTLSDIDRNAARRLGFLAAAVLQPRRPGEKAVDMDEEMVRG